MLFYIADELDSVVMDVVAARYMADELAELDKVDILHGGLQRALWQVFDSIKDNLEALSKATFEAATEAKQ